jgi:hypothetical protein
MFALGPRSLNDVEQPVITPKLDLFIYNYALICFHFIREKPYYLLSDYLNNLISKLAVIISSLPAEFIRKKKGLEYLV